MATTPERKKRGFGFAITSLAFALAAGVSFALPADPDWLPIVFLVLDALCTALTIKFIKPDLSTTS
jgi:hypothetical protein